MSGAKYKPQFKKWYANLRFYVIQDTLCLGRSFFHYYYDLVWYSFVYLMGAFFASAANIVCKREFQTSYCC